MIFGLFLLPYEKEKGKQKGGKINGRSILQLLGVKINQGTTIYNSNSFCIVFPFLNLYISLSADRKASVFW